MRFKDTNVDTFGASFPLASSKTSLAEFNFFTSGGCGRGEGSISGTSSSLNRGCQRVILESGIDKGLVKLAKNSYKQKPEH